MKLFRNLAKQMVNTANKAVENAAKVDNQDKLRDNLSKRFENVADFLENDRDREEEKQQMKEKQRIREQYQQEDYEEGQRDQRKHFEQMSGKKLNINEEPKATNTKQDLNAQQSSQKLQGSESAVPFMITRAMKLELFNYGYELDEINEMTPAEAHALIKKLKVSNRPR